MKNIFALVGLVSFLIFFSCEIEKDCPKADPDLCGNSILDNYEDCDGIFIPWVYSTNCRDWGYNGGFVYCTDNCNLDFSECEEYGVCGDGVLSPQEACEGGKLNKTQCSELGHHEGVLGCTDNCSFDISDCKYCGDHILQEEYGEMCEKENFPARDCSFIGKWGYPLYCQLNCQINDDACDNFYFFSAGRFDSITDITVDTDGNLYILGYTSSWEEGSQYHNEDCIEHTYVEYPEPLFPVLYPCWEAVLYKLSPEGVILWSKQWGTESDDRAFSIFMNETSIETVVFENINLPYEYTIDKREHELKTNNISLVSFDFEGNQLSKTDIPITSILPRKITKIADKIVVSGSNSRIYPSPKLVLIDPETKDESSLLSTYHGVDGIVIDTVAIDSTWVAILSSVEDEMVLSKININDGTGLQLDSSPDNYTLIAGQKWDYNIYRTPASLLLKHKNSDLYYINQEKISEISYRSTLVRVTTDGTRIKEYTFPDYNMNYSNNNLTQTPNGDIIITKTLSSGFLADLPGVPENYSNEIMEVIVIDEDLTNYRRYYKILDNFGFQDDCMLDYIAGARVFGNYAYIFGKSGFVYVSGFIWRLDLSQN
jgi:hypothetical protein